MIVHLNFFLNLSNCGLFVLHVLSDLDWIGLYVRKLNRIRSLKKIKFVHLSCEPEMNMVRIWSGSEPD